ncbi:hypothetical protein PG991_015073 [Apiospora marii]|uniref:Uncharacterized protein n=1 Tax=Apiospora marii TaxID=335849 RepID=A0ABR1R325_9PEZI
MSSWCETGTKDRSHRGNFPPGLQRLYCRQRIWLWCADATLQQQRRGMGIQWQEPESSLTSCAITAAVLSQVGGSWEDTIRWREESELAVTVGRLDSRKEHLKKWAGSVWRIGIEGSKNGDVIRKFRGAMDESMGALPIWFGPVLGGYTLALRAPPSTGATQVRGTVFPSMVQCRQCVRVASRSVGIGIWHLALAGLAATTLLSALATTPYPDNCVAPAGCGRVSKTLALSLSFSFLLHHPSSRPPPSGFLPKSQSHSFGGVTLNPDAKIQWRVPTATLAWSTGAVPVPTHWGIPLGAADPGPVSHGRSTEYPNKKPPCSEHWRATSEVVFE